MSLKNLASKIGVSEHVLDSIYINPLNILVADEFAKPISYDPDYRVRAIRRAVKARVDFCSEDNTVGDMLQMFVSVKCPHCGRKTEPRGGGGNNSQWTETYQCKRCGTVVTLSIGNDGIRVAPKE